MFQAKVLLVHRDGEIQVLMYKETSDAAFVYRTATDTVFKASYVATSAGWFMEASEANLGAI